MGKIKNNSKIKMHFIRKRRANTIEEMFDEILLKQKYFCPEHRKFPRRTGWKLKIDLVTADLPTNPEDIKVKIDSKRNLLSVSGKSEVAKTMRDGLKIKSKIDDGILYFTGNLKKTEKDSKNEIPILFE